MPRPTPNDMDIDTQTKWLAGYIEGYLARIEEDMSRVSSEAYQLMCVALKKASEVFDA